MNGFDSLNLRLDNMTVQSRLDVIIVMEANMFKAIIILLAAVFGYYFHVITVDTLFISLCIVLTYLGVLDGQQGQRVRSGGKEIR